MWSVIKARLAQGHRTLDYPATAPELPDRFRGLPVLEPGRCPEGCADCAGACPTQAIRIAASSAPSVRRPAPKGRCATPPNSAWRRAPAERW